MHNPQHCATDTERSYMTYQAPTKQEGCIISFYIQNIFNLKSIIFFVGEEKESKTY